MFKKSYIQRLASSIKLAATLKEIQKYLTTDTKKIKQIVDNTDVSKLNDEETKKIVKDMKFYLNDLNKNLPKIMKELENLSSN